MDRQTITVDIAPGSGPIQRIRLSQGDIGRQLGVYIIQNGAAVDCSGYSAHLYVLKPDGNYYEKSCSISSNLITWTTAAQETPLAGECKAQIRITANGMDIGTANFIEAIEATPAAGGTASESLISSMTQYVDAAETAARTAVEAEDTVEDIISTYSGIPGRVTNAENSLAATQDGLAIVANGNTHAAIASGQFVYVKNHGSLAEGLYVANSAIGTNATLTTSNLTADGSGGLNALKAKIGNVGNTDLQAQVTSLNSKLGVFSIYTGGFSAQSPGKIEDVITSLPSGIGKYIILCYYGGYSFANSVSMYFIQRGDSWYGLQQIAKGSEARTVTISTDGTVSKGENNTYIARLVAIKIIE